MFKSKAHFKVYHPGKVTLVPVSYIAIIQSQRTKSEESAVRLALEAVLGHKVRGDVKYNKGPLTPFYDYNGEDIPPGAFTVIEYSSGFDLKHNQTGQTHWLSDGVDVLSYDEGYDGDMVTLSPGTLGFDVLWTEEMNNSKSETMEAYFPDIPDEDE